LTLFYPNPDPPEAENLLLKKDWIHFKYFLSDRINRMNGILSRFPEETVKIASACRRKLENRMNEMRDAMFYLLLVNSTKP